MSGELRPGLISRGALLWALVCAALLLSAASARADLLYWDNFGPGTVSFADPSGAGGGSLNFGELDLLRPSGMAIDSATGRLFVADNIGGPGGNGQILAVNLDGSGAARFSAPNAIVDRPGGIAIDPISRTVYWANISVGLGSISWAKLDGSAGGMLNISGATRGSPASIALDTAGGRIYWVDIDLTPNVISYASLNNSGGGDLNIAGATPPNFARGLVVDPAAGRIYWLDQDSRQLSFAAIAGTGGGDLGLPAGSALAEPFGLAFDPLIGRFYWGNTGGMSARPGAIGIADLSGAGGGIDIATAPVGGPQDPLILKSPTAAGAPTVVRVDKSRSTLACSTGSWAPDFAGSHLYRGPSRFAYQWTRNGKALAGANASILSTTAPGSHVCIVTGSNQAGSATQTSAATTVKPARLKLTLKRKVVARAGGIAKLKLKVANTGDLTTKPARLCLEAGKRAKALKASKCKKLGRIGGGFGFSGGLRLRVGPGAAGTYRVKLVVKGARAKAAAAKIVVRP